MREGKSEGARACTPLMAPSGYSRGTLSYLLFSAGCRRKREEKEKNQPAVEERQGRERGSRERAERVEKGRGFIRKHHTRVALPPSPSLTPGIPVEPDLWKTAWKLTSTCGQLRAGERRGESAGRGTRETSRIHPLIHRASTSTEM